MSDGAYCFVGISVSACASSRTPVPPSIAARHSEAQRYDMTAPERTRVGMGKGIQSPFSLLRRCGGMPCIMPLDSGAGRRYLPVELCDWSCLSLAVPGIPCHSRTLSSSGGVPCRDVPSRPRFRPRAMRSPPDPQNDHNRHTDAYSTLL